MNKLSVTFNLERTSVRGNGISANEARKLKSSKDKSKSLQLNPFPTAIYLWVTYGAHRIKVRTGLYIKPVFWDSINKRAVKNSPGHIEFNRQLQKIEDQAYSEIFKQQSNNSILILDDLKQLLKGLFEEKQALSRSGQFFEVYEAFMKQKQTEVKEGTMKKYRSTGVILKKFQAETNFEMHLCKVDRKFDTAYRNWRLNVSEATNNTLSKDYDVLRSFLSWANEEGYHENSYYEKLTIGRKKPSKAVLELEEFKAVLALDLTDNLRLERIRDIFCFQCFTGQRVSDIKELKWKDLNINSNGDYEFWILSQAKGSETDTLEIPILPEANTLLKKYKSIGNHPNVRVLPTISDQKYNDYIKEILMLAGVNSMWKVIMYSGKNERTVEGPKYKFGSSHMARRTFITLCLQFGMPYEAIMMITGQRRVETLRGYASLTKEYQKKYLFEKWKETDEIGKN